MQLEVDIAGMAICSYEDQPKKLSRWQIGEQLGFVAVTDDLNVSCWCFKRHCRMEEIQVYIRKSVSVYACMYVYIYIYIEGERERESEKERERESEIL